MGKGPEGRSAMKKLLTTSLVFCLVFAVIPEALCGKPKYKALFNLASDARYYKYVEYKSPHRFEDTLLLSLIDKRTDEEKIFNKKIQWFSDDVWALPLAKMLEKIFSKELKFTNMFNSVDVNEKAPSLILEIKLISLIGHYGDGRVARGALKVHSVLRSASANRIIMDRSYEEASSSTVRPFGNVYSYMYFHIGKSLHAVVKEILMDLESALVREKRK